MTFLVGYDGSPLAKSALLRAAEFESAIDGELHVVTVVPVDGDLARERGWLDAGETFSRQRITDDVTREVGNFVDGATVHCRFVEKYAPRGRTTRMIRTVADELDATVLFVGSESAGRLVSGLASVGQGVAYGEYDLHVVRRPHPSLA